MSLLNFAQFTKAVGDALTVSSAVVAYAANSTSTSAHAAVASSVTLFAEDLGLTVVNAQAVGSVVADAVEAAKSNPNATTDLEADVATQLAARGVTLNFVETLLLNAVFAGAQAALNKQNVGNAIAQSVGA